MAVFCSGSNDGSNDGFMMALRWLLRWFLVVVVASAVSSEYELVLFYGWPRCACRFSSQATVNSQRIFHSRARAFLSRRWIDWCTTVTLTKRGALKCRSYASLIQVEVIT